MPPRKKSPTPAKKPTAKKPATKKPTTTPKAKAKSTPKVQKKSSTTPKKKTTTRKKPEPKPTFKRKELTPEQMFPFESFPFRLEYQDGTDHRVCHFQCEEHRTKHIERYKLKKGTYYADTASS